MKTHQATARYLLPLLLASHCAGVAAAEGDTVIAAGQLPTGEPSLTIHISNPHSDPGHSLPQRLDDRIANLRKAAPPASLPEETSGQVLFDLPIRKGITNTRQGFYAVSNYVDLDPVAPDMLLDYECGQRTYDLEDGRNHNGVDYFNFPFPWLTMEQDGSIVVAAADGTIIEKRDGENDKSCEFSDSAVANEVWLEHSDGSATVYTHLKKGSTTAKNVGETVEAGEYLGVVGSSGFSTGPHLHFGVYDADNNLVEPHTGDCNPLDSGSLWKDQEDYYETSIVYIATGSQEPELSECVDPEKPFREDSFSPGETVWLTFAVRDALPGEIVTLEVITPFGTPWFTPISQPLVDEDHVAALTAWIGVESTDSDAAGAYIFRVNYGSRIREHTFYINASPPTPPSAVVANNAQNGLFFDPDKDGEGYNFVTANAGTVIYFYGSDKNGNRLWLISDLIPGRFGPGSGIEVTMFESTGGTFDSPVPSARGLSVWGNLALTFDDCDSAVATLTGVDGVKVSNLVKLAGVAGTDCAEGGVTADSPWSGLWFAVADEGEGYNLIVAPNGAILYFYGFKSDGRRLWLISDLIVDELQIGEAVAADMYEATQGDFDNPVPSAEALSLWGNASITLVDCSNITIELLGDDGAKNSVTIRLAGVIGLDCSD